MAKRYSVELVFPDADVSRYRLVFRVRGRIYARDDWDIVLEAQRGDGEDARVTVNGYGAEWAREEEKREEIWRWIRQLVLDLLGNPVEP